MRDLQTSGIVGLSASKVGYRHSDRHGEVNDKKKMLPFCQQFLPAFGQRRVLLVDTHTRGIKSFLTSPLVITGGNEISICIPRHASHQFQLLMS